MPSATTPPRRRSRNLGHSAAWMVISAAAAFALGTRAFGQTLYDSTTAGATASLFPFVGNNPYDGTTGGTGYGDDYNTGYNVVLMTGFSFYGGDTDPNQTNYGLQISFFTLTGVRVATIYPSASEVYGIGLHTLSAGDLTQNGAPYVPITGAGYVVFQPYYFTLASVINGVQTNYPPPNAAPQFTLGFGGTPTVGANDPTLSAQTLPPAPGALSSGAYAGSAGAIGQTAQFSIQGTGLNNSVRPLWALAGSGSWDSSSSWTQGLPSGSNSTATFAGSITGNATVTLATPRTLGAVNFENSSYSYTLAGSAPLTLAANGGPGVINSWAGSHTISCPVVFSAGLNVTALPDSAPGSPSLTLRLAVSATGTLTKGGTGTLAFAASSGGITPLSLPAVAVNSGTVQLLSSGTHTNRVVLVTSSLTIASAPGGLSGSVDLGDSDAIIQGGASNLVQLQQYIAAWYDGGKLDGAGLKTSLAGGAGVGALVSLGMIVNDDGTGTGTPLYATFDGVASGSSDVLVKYTYIGDTTLKGYVDATDVANVLAGLNGGLSGWQNGDFDYSGSVTASDLALVLRSLANQGAPLGVSGGGASGAVPEPSVAITLLAAVPLLQRRRR